MRRGSGIDLLHVVAGVKDVELPPSAERDGAQNGMIGDLDFGSEALLALRERLIHLFEVRED